MGQLIPIYIQVSSGNTVSNYGVPFDDILVVKREGIGQKIDELPIITYTEVAAASTFLWSATKPTAIPPGLYMVKTSSTVAPFTFERTEKFQLGPSIQENYRYTIQIDTVIVGYTTQAGDTATDILTALASAVNLDSYPTTVTASVIGGPLLQIELDNPAYVATPGYHFHDFYLYKSGRFVTWDGDFYLVSESESNNSLPAIPAASDPYDWSELTYMPGGVGAWLAEPGYTVQGYFPISEGAVNIENVPTGDEGEVLDGETAYYGNGVITFAEPFNNEIVLILYKT